MKIEDLIHVKRPLKGGGQVLVLNRGEVITSEDAAMLQAMYSRSPDSVENHLAKLAKAGSGRFMETFYIGYGHKSIGDCGEVTIFIEGVSMLVAKAVQDWMLYRGQECSTRYLDFSKQPFVNPTGLAKAETVLANWRQFYTDNLPVVRAYVAEQFPIKPGEDEKVYNKAISARAFDIMRSFLPAGAQTSLSWTVDLRQVADKLLELKHHPLEEVKGVAWAIEDALKEAYPSSFSHRRHEETESYYESWMNSDLYFLSSLLPRSINTPQARHWSWPTAVTLVHRGVNKDQLKLYWNHLCTRPPKTELPKKLARAGVDQFRFLLDFGSYRDLQRHRAVIQQMPLLTTCYGFEHWYLDQLPPDLRGLVVRQILPSFEKELNKISEEKVGPFQLQYLIPMGYRVQCEITGDLPALVYLVELRSGSSVHPTMRQRAQELGAILLQEYRECGLFLHIDKSDIGRFDVRRGEQDIVEK